MSKFLTRTALPVRLQGAALDYLGGGTWRLWLHTADHVHGTYLELRSDGSITRVTERSDGSIDVYKVTGGNDATH